MLKTAKYKAEDIQEMAAFIETCNQIQEQHVGYCGVKCDEIAAAIVEITADSSLDERFVVYEEAGSIIGICGLDIGADNGAVELWGPFVREDDVTNQALLHAIWQDINKLIWAKGQKVTQVEGFYDTRNRVGIPIFEWLGGECTGVHSVLQLKRAQWLSAKEEQTSSPYKTTDQAAFVSLHESCFPGTYMSAESLIKSIDDQHALFVCRENSEMAGYIYASANAEFGEGTIEYIAVDERYRHKGIGSKLLRQALSFLFHYPSIEDIQLCVSHSNRGALSLYEKCEFVRVRDYAHYKLSIDSEIMPISR
ncbi:GNAT family N-acetyltransferase [Paenibacillus sp. ACRRX]|uniref:GNAT family N-acetyltransferase n=1 Tax=unclassified Paenibacillus TaxID=185978 RepID=UPI001EF629B3|nr:MULTISPECIES: N-acetyltransferase [unclassified Paenibacillus]MCG7410252.1 GNAT family N-acetyltransferase [Paenibacillus sp. ACRRX]MDK8181081.1 N-acetyltransferase [Paenibacillus sp. UMB4589-SE434]